MDYPNPFDSFEVISTYTDAQGCEDGILVAINPKDRISRSLWEYFVSHAPKDSRPPNCWPVDMLGWFRAKTADDKALALAKGVISTHASQARRVYEENIGGGIHKLFAHERDGVLVELKAGTLEPFAGVSVLWLIPNENGGITLMFPEDY